MLGGVSNEGVFDAVRTFKTALTASDVGKAVAITANDTVGLGAAGGAFAGKLERVEKDGTARVRMFGNTTIGYSGAAPALGAQVVLDGAGKVKAVGTETVGRGIVTAVDATKLTVTIEL